MFSKKDEVNLEDLMGITPALLYLHTAFVLYCGHNDLPVTITSIMDKVEGRVSDAHHHGRAIDYSSRGWTSDDVEGAVKHFNKKYAKLAAVSYTDNKPRALIHHRDPNTGALHFHLQVRWMDYPELIKLTKVIENYKSTKLLACLRK